ncbi:uncharacterized protein LOC133919246 [Phragmites australis]|uniref:uncharacterized protein LOC133919246 n=1 Tax=Phragmites australis TaxID=29695 RepID=UPI002D780486|nr:uncharacterized protein LOC133919246 [Phragmites australis]XP_062219570.1 uncharacterized protein LOC133919246 [Phragmites australis]
MAFPTPAAVFVDENLHIHRGKRADAPRAKPLKPSAKPGLQERKALQDLSNISKGTALKEERKPLQNVSNTLKDRSVLKERKERSALRSHEAIKNSVTIFADEETKKCHEWAKDGVEGAHFTGNDSQKLDKDVQDKRVKKKVEKVMSTLHGWSDVVFDPVMFPATEVAKFFEEVKGLELEPEILPDINRRLSSSGDKAMLHEDALTDDEPDQYPFLDNKPVEFELRDELGVN